MPSRVNIRELWAETARRHSQNSQYVGTVVDSNAVDGTVMMRVGGRIIRCEVQTGAVVKYGEKLNVSRVPGSAMLRVNTATTMVVVNSQAAGATSSTPSQATPPPTVGVPFTPVLWATAISSSEIFLEWGSTGENTTHFLLERRIEGGSFIQIAQVPVSQTVYADTGLAANTEYCYRVRAANASLFSEWSNIACATTLRDWILVIQNGSQMAVTKTYSSASPTWVKIDIPLPSGALIRCFAIDPDETGAWVLTSGGDTSQCGVFRCSNIRADTPTFSLVYSQATAATDGAAALTTAGWVGSSPGVMATIASGRDGELVVTESHWSGFADRAPGVAWATSNSGSSWMVSVPSGSNNRRFSCLQYLEIYGCHQIEWDGSQYVIGGYVFWPYFHGVDARAYSSDGVSWAISEESASVLDPKSYCGGYSLTDSFALYQWPSTLVSTISWNLSPYRPFMFDGGICYIHEDAAVHTKDYLNVGGVDVVDSDDVFGSSRIGSAAVMDASTYVVIRYESGGGSIVYEVSGDTITDKTGNLLTALGTNWAGGPLDRHYDNAQAEIF